MKNIKNIPHQNTGQGDHLCCCLERRQHPVLVWVFYKPMTTKKDAYWFTHDSNAKDDPKVVMMIEQLGLESYGIFWVLVEILRDQPEFKYPLALIPAVARRYNTTSEKVKAVITNYGLFQIENDEFFFSKSLINRMLPLIEKREQTRQAALTRWGKQRQLQADNKADADVMRSHSDRNANTVQNSTEQNSRKQEIINMDAVFEYYNNNCGSLPKIQKMTKQRKQAVSARCKEYGKDAIVKVIKMAAASDFLTGKNDKGWTANFDWIFNVNRFVKIIEGNYTNKEKFVEEPGANIKDMDKLAKHVKRV